MAFADITPSLSPSGPRSPQQRISRFNLTTNAASTSSHSYKRSQPASGASSPRSNMAAIDAHETDTTVSRNSESSLTHEPPLPIKDKIMANISLSVMLSGFIAVAIAASFCALFFVTQHYERQMENDIGKLYVLEVQRSTTQRIQEHLNVALSVGLQYATSLSYDNTSWKDWEFHRRQLYTLRGVYFADATDVERFYLVAPLFRNYVWRAPERSWEPELPGCKDGIVLAELTALDVDRSTYRCHIPGTRNKTTNEIMTGYRPSQRPWYVAALENLDKRLDDPAQDSQIRLGYPTWSPYYTYISGYHVGATVSIPVFYNHTQFLGVVGVDVDGAILEEYLRRNYAPNGTKLFIVDNSGRLMGTRDADAPVSIFDKELQMIRPINVTETSPYGELFRVIRNDPMGVMKKHTIAETSYYTTHSQVCLPANLFPPSTGFVVYVAVRTDVVTGLLDEGRKVATFVTTIVAAGSIIFVAGVVYLLTRPLRCVADDLERVAQLDLESVSEGLRGPGFPSEVHRLRRSFDYLVQQLIQYRAYMPRSLLKIVRQSDDDEDPSDCESEAADVAVELAGMASSGVVTISDSVMSPISSAASFDASPFELTRNGGPLLISRTVVAVYNLRDTHTLSRQSPKKFIAAYQTNMTRAIETTQQHKGVPMIIFGDMVIVSFNAVVRCTAKERSACRSAQSVLKATNNAFTIGIASGLALCGDLRATPDMRSFGMIGSVVTEASKLQRLNARYDSKGSSQTHALCSGSMLAELTAYGMPVVARDVVIFHHDRYVVLELVGHHADEDTSSSSLLHPPMISTMYNTAVTTLVNDGDTSRCDEFLRACLTTIGSPSSLSVSSHQDDDDDLVALLESSAAAGGGGVPFLSLDEIGRQKVKVLCDRLRWLRTHVVASRTGLPHQLFVLDYK
eukprot:PhM_4_TR10535/c2_g1_i1/m.49005